MVFSKKNRDMVQKKKEKEINNMKIVAKIGSSLVGFVLHFIETLYEH